MNDIYLPTIMINFKKIQKISLAEVLEDIQCHLIEETDRIVGKIDCTDPITKNCVSGYCAHHSCILEHYSQNIKLGG